MVPTHGWSCRTRTFPARCRDCREAVFFFSCNCGSIVLFEELGHPWPEHRCDTLTKLEVKIEELGKDTVEWAFAQQMMTQRFNVATIDPAYRRRVVAAEKAPAREILRMDSYQGVLHRVDGVIRELVRTVDIFQKLRVEPDSIGGRLVAKSFPTLTAQVTLHTGAIGDDEDPESYTFFVDRRSVTEFIVGDFVSVTLTGVELPGGSCYWVGIEIKSGL